MACEKGKTLLIDGSNYFTSETDDPCDLLLLGSELNNSCQKVDGDPNLNKCLVGYLLNGEIKAIVVKDQTGKIVARSVLRSFFDPQGNRVLLLERIYNNLKNPDISAAITDLAIQKAKKMKLPLVSKEVGSGPPCTSKLQFLGGKAPFVYSDVMDSVQSGPFEVSGCHFLYNPNPPIQGVYHEH